MAVASLLFLMIVAFFILRFNEVSAADPDMLQDLCVANLNSTILVNGFTCKPNFTAKDFSFSGLVMPGATNNAMGSAVTPANVQQIPGLNTLGESMARIDYAPGRLNPPHTQSRATEMIFVFPRGLVHFQKNNGRVPAAVIAGFNSQLPGTASIAATLFAATPPAPDHVLTKAFHIGTKEVEKIKFRFRLAPQ